MNSFANRLKSIRESKGFSQQELADQLHIGRSTLANYEQGIREPNFEVMKKIADLLNVTTDYLLCLSDEPNLDSQYISSDIFSFLEDNEYSIDELQKIAKFLEETKNEIISDYINTLDNAISPALINYADTNNDIEGKTNGYDSTFFTEELESIEIANNRVTNIIETTKEKTNKFIMNVESQFEILKNYLLNLSYLKGYQEEANKLDELLKIPNEKSKTNRQRKILEDVEVWFDNEEYEVLSIMKDFDTETKKELLKRANELKILNKINK